MTEQTTTDFDGCRRTCRKAGAHTLVWGDCEYAPKPEPTVSMSKVFTDIDGQKSIGFDNYTVQQLADLIEPALRHVAVRFGPNALAMLQRGETVGLSGGEYADLAREAARAIVHRNDSDATPPARLPVSEARTRLLQALDASYCQALGHTPEGLLAAYEASRTQTVDQTALRDRIAEVLLTTSRAEWPYTTGHEKWDHHKHGDRPGHTFSISCALCTGDVNRLADAVLAVLPATTNHDTDTSDWSALAERTGRLRKTTKELVDRTEELETKVTQLAADQAASLREAADRLPDADLPFVSPMGRQQTADWLRRVADETAATETPCTCFVINDGGVHAINCAKRTGETAATETEAQQQVDVEALARLLSDADVYVNHGDYPGWDDLAESGEQQYRRAARYLLKRLHIAERQPAAGARQDGAQ